MSSPFNRHQRITAERLGDKNPSGIISFNAHRLTWFSPSSPRPNPWKSTVGCFLLCLNNIHLQDRWHIRHYISLHDCHYNLEGQIVASPGQMHKWRKVVCAILPVCPLLQRGSKTVLLLFGHAKLLTASIPRAKKERRKRLGLRFPAILACIQDCTFLSWSEIK